MTWMNAICVLGYVETWLFYSALSGFLILSLGALGVWFCKEPIYRIRITQWTFAACLFVPLIQITGLMPSFETQLSWPNSAAISLADAPVQTSSNAVSDSIAADENSITSINSGNYSQPKMSTVAETFDVVGLRDADRKSSVSHVSNAVTSSAFKVRNILTLAWCVCAGFLAIQWVVGFALRRRIAARSRLATKDVHAALKTIAGEKASRVRLLSNEKIKSPVMWGLVRPTIVIPAAHLKDSTALRWGLAHEWHHVVNLDFPTRLLAVATKLVCFFQPCFWWLNRELTLNQDVLADAFAAKQGHADEYAAFLVNLSKQNRPRLVPVGLGIAEGRSTMFRRIRSLLEATSPLQKTGRVAAVIIAVVSIATITCLGAVRLGAGSNNAEDMVTEHSQVADKVDDEKAAMKKVEPKGKPTVHFGVVVDSKTSLPIAGAKVHIKRELSRDPKTGKWILLEQTEHVTNLLGVYSFSLSAEQVAQSSLYLEVKTEHPDYQTQGWGGYSYSMIQKNMKKGDLPWFSKINLQSGEEVSGTIVDPEGNPLPNVRIAAFTKEAAKNDDRGFRGNFSKTRTNEEGHFRFIAPTPGDGVMWIFPENYAPQAHRLASEETVETEKKRWEAMSAARTVEGKLGSGHADSKAAMANLKRIEEKLEEVSKESGIRRDFGTMKMQPGTRLSGKVLDAEGNPVPGVGVNLRRKGDGEAVDQFLNHNAVANGIAGGTMTNPDGTFQMKPLPPGSYRVQIEETVEDPTVGQKENWFEDKGKEKLKHVFAPKNIEITSEPMESLVFQAVPHVTIRGQYFDSSGKPKAGHQSWFAGQMNDGFYSTRTSRPDKEGRFEVRVPKGITEASMNLTTNEHSSLRWKLPNSESYSRADTIRFETLDKDIEGLEIVKYVAPIIVIRVEDTNGKPVYDFSISSRYTKQDEKDMHGYYTGDVGFEKQTDGRWRSSQLLPDEEISIEIRTPVKRDRLGNEEREPVSLAEAQTVTLKEGETRNLKFVVEPLAK
jgi:beta-lactamase regulating signal transducer with metallopeptidase domain/protocatechuate 3,4-dioxygenase beta subunit